MSIDWWTFGLQTINVLILVWILKRFLFRPVARIIARRQDAAQADLDAAEAARAEAESVRAAAQAELDSIAAHRASLIAEAADEAAGAKCRLLEAAREEIASLHEVERANLDRMRDAEARRLAEQAGMLAADIAARLLDRLPEEDRIAAFMDGLVNAVADLPEATRNGIGTDGPVVLRAARDLTRTEEDLLKSRLGGALGRVPEFSVVIDPALIAGLELDAPHAVVRNHLRADLDRIREELAENE